MSTGRNRESLKKFAQTIERLDLEKRVAATKWLEGVIVAQNLTAEEREELVRASNEYIGSAGEEDYVDEVNALMDYLRRVQRESNRALKKLRKKHLVENLATA
jgi:chorismate mutase